MKAPLLPISIAWAFGIALGWALPLPLGIAWLISAACVLFFCASRGSRMAPWILTLLWCCLGLLRISLWLHYPEQGMRALVPMEPQAVAVRGHVIGTPDVLEGAFGGLRERFTVGIDHLRIDGRWRLVPGRVQIIRTKLEPSLSAGERILASGMWSVPSSAHTPGGWDARAALARRRIHAVLRQRALDPIVRLEPSRSSWLDRAVAAWRLRWTSLLRDRLDPSQARVLQPLLLGDRSVLDERLRDALVRTGTFHLMVISGFHVGLVVLLLNVLGRLLRLPRSFRLAWVAFALGAYCLLVGLRPPIVRATLMAWMVLGAIAWGRVIDWANLTAAAAFIILLFDPAQLFDPGFQLSFGAVASLLAFGRSWTRRFSAGLRWVRPFWLRRYLAMNLGCTAAIEIGMWPVLAWYFYLLTPVSLIANLLLVPLVSCLVVLGILGLAAGMCWQGSLVLLAPVFSVCTTLIEICAYPLASLPGGSWVIGRPSVWLAGVYYGLLAASMLYKHLGISRVRLISAWLTGISLWALLGAYGCFSASRALTVDVLDVGDGDCLVVRPPRGGVWVIDAGTEVAGRRTVVPFLRYSGIRRIDLLWITHPDGDHLGGAIPILETFPVRRLLTNGSQDATMAFRHLMTLAQKKQIVVEALSAGSFNGTPWGLEAEVLHPPAGFVPGTRPEDNENSLVIRMAYQGTSFLSTGDIDGAGVPDLLGRIPQIQSTVLKVPHHGSLLLDSGSAFFEAVGPEIAVISVGRQHGLPAPETIAALKSTGIEPLLTRETGALRLRLDGKQVSVQRLVR